MTREAFIAKYLDETIGMMLAAFAQTESTRHKASDEHWAQDGRFMMQQMRRSKELLGKIWDELQPAKPPEKPADKTW